MESIATVPGINPRANVMGLNGAPLDEDQNDSIMSCFMYAEKELKIKNVQSWSYQTSLKFAEDRNNPRHQQKCGIR